jgi:hypothetical protein
MSREEGEGVLIAKIAIGRTAPSLAPTTSFWIPRLPLLLRLVWTYQNIHGSWYYQRVKRKGAMSR